MREITEEEIVRMDNMDLKLKLAENSLGLAMWRLLEPLINAFADGYLALAEAIDKAVTSGNEIDARKIIFGGTP